jgi:hypothetical protein
MTDPDFIESKLSIQTNAVASERTVKNNRLYYRLVFDENLGWDWLVAQVDKVSAQATCVLEVYKFGPVEDAVGVMVVEVRELQRREGIDDGQRGLDSFDD